MSQAEEPFFGGLSERAPALSLIGGLSERARAQRVVNGLRTYVAKVSKLRFHAVKASSFYSLPEIDSGLFARLRGF